MSNLFVDDKFLQDLDFSEALKSFLQKNAQLIQIKSPQQFKLKDALYLLVNGFVAYKHGGVIIDFFSRHHFINPQILNLNCSQQNNEIHIFSETVFLEIPISNIQSLLKQYPLVYLDVLSVVMKFLGEQEKITVAKMSLAYKWQFIQLFYKLYLLQTYYPFATIPITKNHLRDYFNCSTSVFYSLWKDFEKKMVIKDLGRGFKIIKESYLISEMNKIGALKV